MAFNTLNTKQSSEQRIEVIKKINWAQRESLAQADSKLLLARQGGTTGKRRATYTLTKFWLVMGLLLLAIVFSFVITVNFYVVVALLIIVGIFGIYHGIRTLGTKMLLSNTPVVQAAGAAIGLNEIRCRPVTENGLSLTAPITKRSCFYYKLELHEISNTGNSSSDMIIAAAARGIPTIMADSSGGVACRFEDAEIEFDISRMQVGNTDKNQISELSNYIESKGDSADDFAQGLDHNSPLLGLKPIKKLPVPSRRGGILNSLQYYLVEYCLPTDKDYYIFGYVDNTAKNYNGRQVCTMDTDPSSRIFSILPNSKEKAMSQLNHIVIGSIGIGIILLALAAFIFPHMGPWTAALIAAAAASNS
jgi:hypothetical protein